MKEILQAGSFYRSLDNEQQSDLCNAIAENIFFLDDALQDQVVQLLLKADRALVEEIISRNSFTKKGNELYYYGRREL